MESNAALADFASDKQENRLRPSGTESLSARLAVENQSGAIARNTESPVIHHLELCDSQNDDNSSREPCYELPFSAKPVKGIVLHNSEPGETAQKLAVGGQIARTGNKIELNFSNNDRVVVNVKTGGVLTDSEDQYQKEVHFENTPWQRTVVTSDNNTRITVGSQNISSIERNGIMEIFPRSYSMLVGAEPRLPASEELQRKLGEKGRNDLKTELSKIDRAEDSAEDELSKNHGDRQNVAALAETFKDRGIFLEKAAEALPADKIKLDACAENQLRTALRNMREQFGAGTPETRKFAEALLNMLENKGNADQQEEVERLTFEAKRGRLMKNVADNINDSPGENYQSLDRERAQSIRQSLISIHIAGGDDALKAFVDDVNQRLKADLLIAPYGQDGPFHSGAIILTPEGATRYNGSFNLVPRPGN